MTVASKTAASVQSMEDVRQVIAAADGNGSVIALKVMLTNASTDIVRFATAQLKALKAI